MRFVNLDRNGTAVLAASTGGAFIDLARVAPDLPGDLAGLLAGGDAAMAAARAAVDGAGGDAEVSLEGARYRAPIERPGKILCLGLNYADHASETQNQKPDYPVIFARHTNTLIAHGDAMLRPACSEQLDYEAELVAVIGKTCHGLTRDNALEAVAGYSCFNDGSVREYQFKSSQWTLGKNFDATGAFGPVFVTADELPAGGRDLSIQCRLNGEVVQDANTSDMLFDVTEALEVITEVMTLEAGDLVVMGTPAGVGAARTPPLWMKDGDVCEVEIEKIGLLSNPIRDA